MTVNEAYQVMQRECGFKVGDKVKVLRTAKSCDLGWEMSWSSLMDSFVGHCFEILKSDAKVGFILSNDRVKFYFPWFVLELVERPVKEMTVSEVSKELGYEIKIVKG